MSELGTQFWDVVLADKAQDPILRRMVGYYLENESAPGALASTRPDREVIEETFMQRLGLSEEEAGEIFGVCERQMRMEPPRDESHGQA